MTQYQQAPSETSGAPSSETSATETSPKANPTAGPAQPLSPALKGFLGGLAGGIAVSVLAAGGLAAVWPGLRAQALSPVDRRLTVLERAIDDLNPRLSALERQQAAAGGADTALSVQSLSQRVATLEAQTHGPTADPRVGAVAEQNDRLAADVTRLNGEVEALRRAMPPEGTILRLAEQAQSAEKTAREIASRHQSAQALLLVVGQLREAVDRGDPFETELRAARRVAPAEDAAALDTLSADAPTGVARKDSLIAAFPTLSNDIVRAAVVPADGTFWQRTLNKMTSLVSVRRIDGKGDGIPATVARAEARLKERDLSKAVQELAGLQGDPARVAAPWVKAAEARIAADRAMSEIAATAAAETAKSGG